MEERLDIDTPEGVVFGYQVAGIGSRFIAALMDTSIILAVLCLFCCGLWAATHLYYVDSWVMALATLFIFVLLWGYYIFFEIVWNGQTPGKRRAGLRVIRTDGMPITLVDSLIRNLVRVIDFLPFFYTVGLVTMFLNAQARRLGDYAAGTLVVKEQRDVTLESVRQTVRVGTYRQDLSAIPDLSASDYQLIIDFLGRRHELHNRAELARRIAGTMVTKLGLPQPTTTGEAEELLVQLARRTGWE